MSDLEKIIGFDALYEAAHKCKRGVMWKDSVAHFMLNDIQEIIKLEHELKTGTYKEGRQQHFRVTSPKPRDIVSVPFRDRVYQRSLNDNAIYPQIAPSFIYDNCACQKGKGTSFARDRLKCHMQRFYRKHGLNGYVLQCDIRKYYPSMRHDVTKAVFKKHLDPEVYEMAARCLDTYGGEIGYNPGSQMIQIAGLSVLNDLDHYIKERLRVKHYLRYMDDMILLGETVEELQSHKAAIEKKLQAIGFELHPEKTKIYPLSNGIHFLGFHFRLTETGKVILLLHSDNVRSYRRKLRRLVGKAQNGIMTKADVDCCFRSWKAHAENGNTYRIRQRMDTYYNNLWEG